MRKQAKGGEGGRTIRRSGTGWSSSSSSAASAEPLEGRRLLSASLGGAVPFAPAGMAMPADAVVVQQEPYNGSPFTIGPESGGTLIELEDYDIGGEGVAYHDTTPDNLGGAYRTGAGEGVDVKQIKGAPDGNYRLSNVAAGEWAEYTIYVRTGNIFGLEFTASQSRPGGKFHAEVDGVNVTGTLTVPDTGSFDKLATVSKTGIKLEGGAHVLRVSFDRNASGSDSVGGFGGVRFIPMGEIGQAPIAAATYVRDGSSAKVNFGSAPELLVKKANGTGNNRETLIRIDLTKIAVIDSAKLNLYGALSDDSAPNGIKVAAYGSTSTGWSEDGVTWSSRPGTTGSTLSTVTIKGTEGDWYSWDVTAFLKARKAAGKTSATIVLRGVSATSPFVRFTSDDETAFRPSLG